MSVAAQRVGGCAAVLLLLALLAEVVAVDGRLSPPARDELARKLREAFGKSFPTITNITANPNPATDPDISWTQDEAFYADWANAHTNRTCPDLQSADVAVLKVDDTWNNDPIAVSLWKSWHAFFSWAGMRVLELSPANLANPACGGQLRNKSASSVQIFAMPGGQAQLYAGFAGARDHLQRFMDCGGLYVGSCGGFGYFTSRGRSFNHVKPGTYPGQDWSFDEFTTSLSLLEMEVGPVFGVGAETPGRNGSAPVGGEFVKDGRAVIARLSDPSNVSAALFAAYAGGSLTAGTFPGDAEVLQRFEEVPGKPPAAVHFSGKRNALGFTYHPEMEIALPEKDAGQVGCYVRQMMASPSIASDLPTLQLKAWTYLATQVRSAMEKASLPVPPKFQAFMAHLPEALRYTSPEGVAWDCSTNICTAKRPDGSSDYD